MVKNMSDAGSGLAFDGSSGEFSLENDNIATSPETPTSKTSNGRNSKTTIKKGPIPPPPRATAASSSGFPGVSWNKRMGAWLSFYYDSDTRRSRTFHPKYYDFDVEKAKQAAIEFMKTIEKHPRCSLRKTRKDTKNNSEYMSERYDMEMPGRTRKRAAANNMLGMEFKSRTPKSPINRQPAQAMSDMYDIKSLKRQFHVDSNIVDPCYLSNAANVDSEYLATAGNALENNYLSGSFESQHDYEKGYPSQSTWTGSNQPYNGPEYYMDSHKYGMPFLEGDVIYPASSPGAYPENDLIYPCGCKQASQQLHLQRHLHSQQAYCESQDMNGQRMLVGNQYDTSSLNEDAEIHMLMQSIALSPSESIDGFRLNTYNYGDSSGNYGNLTPNYSNSCNTPLGSPYLSPYVCSVYNQSSEEDLPRTFGFQSLIDPF